MKKEKIQELLSELTFKFSRSSGPGGQHVNTTDSKAQLSWNFYESSKLSERQKKLIQKNLKHYLTKDFRTLKFSCSQSRSREQNKSLCIKKFYYLLENKAFYEATKRKKTKPTRSSIEKRLRVKKKSAEIKKNRQKVKDY